MKSNYYLRSLPILLFLFMMMNLNAQNMEEKNKVMTNKEVVINFFIETYNNKNYQFVEDYFSDKYYEHREDGARTNLDAIKIIKSAESIFPDLTVKIEDTVEENGIVAIRLTFNATHKGTYLGIKATNKIISWEAMEFFKLESGIITESWGSWPNHDIVSMLEK